jgi:hypothetical protein
MGIYPSLFLSRTAQSIAAIKARLSTTTQVVIERTSNTIEER